MSLQLLPPSSGRAGRRFDGVLPMNTAFRTGDILVAGNGLYFATLRADGTFAVFRGIDDNDPAALLWSSGRPGETGPYFAIVQSDGNFCVYRETGDEGSGFGWHWGSQMTAKGNAFYGTMQEDGNFSVRKGQGPADSCGLIWATGATDRVESIVEVLHIEYDLGNACVLRTSPSNVYNETVVNCDKDQKQHRLRGTISVTTTTAWNNDITARYSADAHFRAPVPVVDGEAIELTGAPTPFLPDAAFSASSSWHFDTPVDVAPNASLRSAVSVTYSTISVPYVLLAALRFESGARVVGPLKGSFRGTNPHGTRASFVPHDPLPDNARMFERRLQVRAGN
ncbi:hypothetical protein IP91_04737 [Pseudoduganella lurida]|uniref:Bulb-type lectin domain-containing protein n=1 Tax=Pseudoduganella lurida TaxID=1036180 RepID=A0A562QY85_9BURK|nr:hypothetical protein [Pseudoduganella lurida]TWI61150.1 hypothetical protein IP91_04737 [Pseudoduganella lurida]